jgi:hypothetical protein
MTSSTTVSATRATLAWEAFAVTSSDFRTASSVLRWLSAALVATGGVASAGCGWVSGSEWTQVARARAPSNAAKLPLRLPIDECKRYCGDLVDSCELASSVWLGPNEPEPEPASPTGYRFDPAAPPLLFHVAICRMSRSGEFQTWGSFGRRPAGAAAPEGEVGAASEHFLRAAYCETAAIVAFQQLALDLEALRAPARLVGAARRAALDEARHARGALAHYRRLGGRQRPRWPALPTARRRHPDLLELALDNAREGCAGEAFGTWLQLFQARFAPDAQLRAHARRVARDEAKHAALAFQLFDWLNARLPRADVLQVRETMVEHAASIDHGSRVAAEVARELGLPEAAVASAAARELSRKLRAIGA